MEQKMEILCKVCGDKASGKHYGVASCDGCRGFFKRSIRRGLAYHCKESGSCVVDVTRRNQCQACRFKKCLAVNMKRDAVQHERAPRASLTAHCPNLSSARRHPYGYQAHAAFLGPTGPVIDLPAYHFVYPQPSFPFPFGVKSNGLGLPNSLGMGIFNCPNSMTAKTAREMLQPHGFYQTLKRSNESCVVSEERTRRTTTTTTTSASSAEEDEVTSSEETRGFRTCSAYDSLTSKPNLMDLTIPQGPESVYESAAKLLFLTVKWARSIPSFLQLNFHDQSTLLEESWSELFVLSAAQWTLPVDEEYLLSGINSINKQELIEKEVKKMKRVMAKFTTLKVDHTEYACLKALTLFKTEITGLKDQAQVEILQDQTHVMLHDYCISQDSHKARFGKLLMLLPSVNLLSKDIIEELLFRKTIGNISIERVLSDMLKSNHTA